jgi:hypothetical protein
MESMDRKLRHDIRGHFQNLLLSLEVLRCDLSRQEKVMFLGQLVNACEAIGELIEQVPAEVEQLRR